METLDILDKKSGEWRRASATESGRTSLAIRSLAYWRFVSLSMMAVTANRPADIGPARARRRVPRVPKLPHPSLAAMNEPVCSLLLALFEVGQFFLDRGPQLAEVFRGIVGERRAGRRGETRPAEQRR